MLYIVVHIATIGL